jgi:hypothetical protein
MHSLSPLCLKLTIIHAVTFAEGYGLRLVARMTDLNPSPLEHASDLHDVVFALLVEEWRLQVALAPSFVHLFGVYLKLLSVSARSSSPLEKAFCELVKTLPVDLFQTSLDAVQKLLRTQRQDIELLALAASVAYHVLHNAPEGTTKASQDFIGICLHVFVNSPPAWVAQAATRSAALDLLFQYVSDRVRELRYSCVSRLTSSCSLLHYGLLI